MPPISRQRGLARATPKQISVQIRHGRAQIPDSRQRGLACARPKRISVQIRRGRAQTDGVRRARPVTQSD